jgi:hypothetical protein
MATVLQPIVNGLNTVLVQLRTELRGLQTDADGAGIAIQPTLFAVILPLDEYCLVSTVAQLSRSNVVASIRFKSIRTQSCSLLLPRSSLALLTISLCCQAELN